MRDRNTTFWRVVTFFRAAAAAGQVVVLVAAHNGKYGSRSVPILMVLVALPASAQVAHGDSNGIAVLYAILLISAPALFGMAAHRVFRSCVQVRDAAILFRLCVYLRDATILRPLISLAHWANQVTKFETANITTIAVPLINECKPRGGTIRLVGGDGSYFTGDNREKLRSAMRKWIIDDDMSVQYLLMRPRADVVKAMKKFSEMELADKGDKLEVFVLEDSESLSEDAKRVADVLGTYHPNLISWPGNDKSTNRAMWLEGMHLPGEDVARDNRWVPPRSMSDPVSGTVAGSTMIWEDTFRRWDEALDDLKQGMVVQ